MHAKPFHTGAFAALALAACASAPPPTDQLGVARAAVDAAQRAGAGELAAVELAQARAELERAQHAMNRRVEVVFSDDSGCFASR